MERDMSEDEVNVLSSEIMKDSLHSVMTFAEATVRWGLGSTTLRSMTGDGRLEEGKEYRKSGKVWLITEAAMIKLYGHPKN